MQGGPLPFISEFIVCNSTYSGEITPGKPICFSAISWGFLQSIHNEKVYKDPPCDNSWTIDVARLLQCHYETPTLQFYSQQEKWTFKTSAHSTQGKSFLLLTIKLRPAGTQSWHTLGQSICESGTRPAAVFFAAWVTGCPTVTREKAGFYNAPFSGSLGEESGRPLWMAKWGPSQTQNRSSSQPRVELSWPLMVDVITITLVPESQPLFGGWMDVSLRIQTPP